MEGEFGLILIASGQNWPNVFSVLHYKANACLSCVLIYATQGMLDKALQLETLVRSQLPEGFAVIRLDRDNSPEAFHTFLDNLPNVQLDSSEDKLEPSLPKQWILNATGGLKTFSFQIANTLTKFSQVIYREYNADSWFVVQLNSDGRLVFSHETSIINDEKAYDIPLELLIAVQTGTEHKISTRGPKMGKTPCYQDYFPEAEEDIIGYLGELSRGEWNDWKSIYKKRYNVSGVSSGDPLEWFVFQACRILCGTQAVHWSVVPNLAEGEGDVLVVLGDKLVLISCKLGSETETGTNQIIEAYTKAHRWGGLSALPIIVSPKKLFTAEQQRYASDLRMTLIDASGFSQIFQTLKTLTKSRVDVHDLENLVAKYTMPKRYSRQHVHDVRSNQPERTVYLVKTQGYSVFWNANGWHETSASLVNCENWDWLCQEGEPRALITPVEVVAWIPKARRSTRPDVKGFTVHNSDKTWTLKMPIRSAERWADGGDLKARLEQLLSELVGA